jgi:hypothetical protein
MTVSGGDSDGGADTTIASTRQGQENNGIRPAQARQRQSNDGFMTELMRERKTARQGARQ